MESNGFNSSNIYHIRIVFLLCYILTYIMQKAAFVGLDSMVARVATTNCEAQFSYLSPLTRLFRSLRSVAVHCGQLCDPS